MDRTERLFRVHRLLASARHGVTRQRLLEALDEQCPDSQRSALDRVIAMLRNTFQAPLEYDRERGVYHYAGGDRFELPGLWFDAEELTALLILESALEAHPYGLLAETLKPLRTRIEALLQRKGVGVPDWRRRLRLLRTAARLPGAHFVTVAGALARRRRLNLHYHARGDDRMSQRAVSPQRLVQYRDNWYLDAWCHTREDLRVFALDRIIAAEALDERAVDVPDDQLDRLVATSYGIFSGEPTATAVLRFSAHAARWVADETWHPRQQDTREDDGSLIRRIPCHRSEELRRDLLRWGAEVEVLEPPELRQQVAEALRRAAARYAAHAEMPPAADAAVSISAGEMDGRYARPDSGNPPSGGRAAKTTKRR